MLCRPHVIRLLFPKLQTYSQCRLDKHHVQSNHLYNEHWHKSKEQQERLTSARCLSLMDNFTVFKKFCCNHNDCSVLHAGLLGPLFEADPVDELVLTSDNILLPQACSEEIQIYKWISNTDECGKTNENWTKLKCTRRYVLIMDNICVIQMQLKKNPHYNIPRQQIWADFKFFPMFCMFSIEEILEWQTCHSERYSILKLQYCNHIYVVSQTGTPLTTTHTPKCLTAFLAVLKISKRIRNRVAAWGNRLCQQHLMFYLYQNVSRRLALKCLGNCRL